MKKKKQQDWKPPELKYQVKEMKRRKHSPFFVEDNTRETQKKNIKLFFKISKEGVVIYHGWSEGYSSRDLAIELEKRYPAADYLRVWQQ